METIVRFCEVFVGLDYHDDIVQVCVMDPQGNILGNRAVANDWIDIKEYVWDVAPLAVLVHAALESCCGAANLAEQLASRAEWDVALGHSGYCNRMKQNPDKTDFTDAQLLADLVRVGYLPRVWMAPREIRELRRLVRYRQQLVEARRDVKLRIRALLRDERVKAPEEVGNVWTQSWLTWLSQTARIGEQSSWIMQRHLLKLRSLSQDIKEVDQRLEEVTQNDPITRQLRQEPGVGLVTAVTMRAEIGRFDRFRSGKQLARFCGLSPRNASSGKRQADAGLIKAGNPLLRTTIVEAAQRLCRLDATWKSFKERMLKRGKPRSVIVAAAANRWVRRLYHHIQQPHAAAA